MLKRITDFLAGVPATVVAGAFLLLDLVPHLTGSTVSAGTVLAGLPLDPAWVTVAISGTPLIYLALWRVVHNRGIARISSALLISIAMVAAIAIGDLFAAGEVAWIMAIGAILEEKTTDRAKKGLRKLIELAPAQGRRVRGGREEMVPASEIRPDDILRILPGETVPVDGEVVFGETSVDQSVMTGESLPVDKGLGDEVYCGTVNRFGSIDIRATKVGEDSSLAQLIRLVRDAEGRQAPMQRIADRAASWLVPVALLIALGAYAFTGDVVKAVTVLVVFCPCALVLATPTAVMAAIGQATKHGVIIKSGEALESMGRVDTVAFDKTGTLTYGRLSVSDVVAFGSAGASVSDGRGATGGGVGEEGLLRLAAAAEARSEHPLARAIVAGARERGVEPGEADDFRMEAGRGVVAAVEGRSLACGSERFVRGYAAIGDGERLVLERLRDEGKASVLVADIGQGLLLGVIGLADVLRSEARDVVGRLEGMGISAVLLTGDNAGAASYFADRAGISEVRADLLPADKVAAVEGLRAEGRCVCMVGDGVNDAPALKAAGVSVAMGGMGSDIAVDAADIALMGDDISKIPYLKRLSVAAVRTIRFSIALSMCINAVAIVLSLAGALTPTTGALWQNAGSVLVVLIAALLYDRRFD